MTVATITPTALTTTNGMTFITVTMTDGHGNTVTGHKISLASTGIDFTKSDSVVIAACQAFLLSYLVAYWQGNVVTAATGPDAAVQTALGNVAISYTSSIP